MVFSYVKLISKGQRKDGWPYLTIPSAAYFAPFGKKNWLYSGIGLLCIIWKNANIVLYNSTIIAWLFVHVFRSQASMKISIATMASLRNKNHIVTSCQWNVPTTELWLFDSWKISFTGLVDKIKKYPIFGLSKTLIRIIAVTCDV